MDKNRASGELVDRTTQKELKDLIQMFKKQGVSEFRLEQEQKGVKLHIVMSKQETQPQPQMVSMTPIVPIAPHTGAPVVQELRKAAAPNASEDKAEEKAVQEEAEHLHSVKSPMVGTFYRASTPEVDPYVEVGDEVEEETVLCIVEAMKLMNEIKAETKGKIVEICIQNGHPVEYGQPLFKLQLQ